MYSIPKSVHSNADFQYLFKNFVILNSDVITLVLLFLLRGISKALSVTETRVFNNQYLLYIYYFSMAATNAK